MPLTVPLAREDECIPLLIIAAADREVSVGRLSMGESYIGGSDGMVAERFDAWAAYAGSEAALWFTGPPSVEYGVPVVRWGRRGTAAGGGGAADGLRVRCDG